PGRRAGRIVLSRAPRHPRRSYRRAPLRVDLGFSRSIPLTAKLLAKFRVSIHNTMRTRLFIAGLLVLSCAVATLAQDPEKLIDQSLKAQGGAKLLAKARTVILEGTFSTAENKPGTYTFNTCLPNRYYSELVIDGHTIVQAYNGKSAWHETPNGD